MKKIGLLCLALVLALGTLGVGFAAWTDTLYIEGEVNTGTVDINIEALSGTWVWKVGHDEVQYHGWGTTENGPEGFTPPAEAEPITSATAEMDPTDLDGDTVIVTFDNLYPCKWLFVDFLVHYEGSIPVILNAEIEETTAGDPWLEDLWNADPPHAGVIAYEWTEPEPGSPRDMNCIGSEIDLCEPIQLHHCDWILVKLWIHIPQEDIYMGLDGSFEASVTAVQWNEYGL